MTIDYTTDAGRVRLLATDVDLTSPYFSDDQIAAFLAVEGDDVRLAAALALETIASSEALVSKKIRTGDGLSTDGPAVAKELRDRATALRAQAAAGSATDTPIDIIDFDPNSWLMDD